LEHSLGKLFNATNDSSSKALGSPLIDVAQKQVYLNNFAWRLEGPFMKPIRISIMTRIRS
jgi:hypothetical protein